MMKYGKRIMVLVFSLLHAAFSFAGENGIHLDVSPYLWFDSMGSGRTISAPGLQEFYDWDNRPPLANLYVKLKEGNFGAYIHVDMKTDLITELQNITILNGPAFTDTGIQMDPNYPRAGYLEYRGDTTIFSFGRRKLHWGPGYYSLDLARQSPYFDHVWFEKYFPLRDNRRWEYAYVLITTDNRASGSIPKTFVSHSLAYQTEKFRFSAQDYNLVWGRFPDLQELAPMVHYHSLYQKDQNVMLGVTVDSLPRPDIRLYGEYLLDDFQISIESATSTPGQMGALWGGQLRLVDGEPFHSPLDSSLDHLLSESSFQLKGGLVLGFEQMWVSQYMYNRDEEGGKFTNTVRYMWEYAPVDVTTFFGAAYGPDSFLSRLSAVYEDTSRLASLVVEHRVFGDHGIEGPYEVPYDNWLTLKRPLHHALRFALSGQLDTGNTGVLRGDLTIDLGEVPRVQAGFGWGKNLF